MRRAALVLLAVAGLAAATASPASDARPQRLGDVAGATDLDYDLRTAIDTGPDGLAVALVRQSGQAVVRRARPGRPFGAARRLPLGTSATSATVAAGAGYAVLAWTHFDATYFPAPYDREEPCCRRVRAALLDRSGRLTHPRTLSAPGANVSGEVSTVRGRRAALAWTDTRGVRTSVGRRDIGFRRPVTITSSQAPLLLGLALPRATPHVFLLVGYKRPRVVEAWRFRGHTRRRTLGPFAGSPFDARAAVTPNGRLLLAANLFRRPRIRRLIVLARRPGGRLHSVRLRLRARSPTTIAVALAPSGRGMVVSAENSRTLALRSVDRSGHVGPARKIATPSLPIESAIAIGRSGAGVLAAHIFGGTGVERHDRVVAWPLGPGGRPGPSRGVSKPGSSVLGGLTVTVDRRVAWAQGRGTYASLAR